MKYRGIIFDLDGVICHTDQYHYQAWKKLADKLEIYFDETINNRLRGVSRMESLEIILENCEKIFSKQEKELLADEKNFFYKELLKKMTRQDLSREVSETLVQLREKGFKLAIGSSSKNAKFILRQIGLLDFFDAISDGNNITHSKPNPEVFLKAAEFLGLRPDQCLVVEDAETGVLAAANGNMDCAGIGNAAVCGAARYSLQCFKDLLSVVEGSVL